MEEWLGELLERKRRMRNQLAELSFTEKIRILEQLRDRSRAIAASPLRQRQEKGKKADR